LDIKHAQVGGLDAQVLYGHLQTIFNANSKTIDYIRSDFEVRSVLGRNTLKC